MQILFQMSATNSSIEPFLGAGVILLEGFGYGLASSSADVAPPAKFLLSLS